MARSRDIHYEQKLSPNFAHGELVCPCCGIGIRNDTLVYLLEAIRNHFDKPVRITSGNRCVDHNGMVGGSPKSQHITGNAADIAVEGVSPTEVYEYCCDLIRDRGGAGLYRWHVHIDTRGKKARWDMRAEQTSSYKKYPT